MPKHGFPVNIVELTILHHGEEARNIRLSCDLKMAISEFYKEMKLTAVYTIMMKMTSMFHQSKLYRTGRLGEALDSAV